MTTKTLNICNKLRALAGRQIDEITKAALLGHAASVEVGWASMGHEYGEYSTTYQAARRAYCKVSGRAWSWNKDGDFKVVDRNPA